MQRTICFTFLVLLSLTATWGQSFLRSDQLNFQGQDMVVHDLEKQQGQYQLLVNQVSYGNFYQTLPIYYDVQGNLIARDSAVSDDVLLNAAFLPGGGFFLSGINTNDPTAPWGLGSYHAVLDSHALPVWYQDSLSPYESFLLGDSTLLLYNISNATLRAVALDDGRPLWQAQPVQWRQSLGLPSSYQLPSVLPVASHEDRWATTLEDQSSSQAEIILLDSGGQITSNWPAQAMPVNHLEISSSRVFTVEGASLGSQDFGRLQAYDTSGQLSYTIDLNQALNLNLQPDDIFTYRSIILEADPSGKGVLLGIHKIDTQQVSRSLSLYYINASGTPHLMRSLDSTAISSGEVLAYEMISEPGPAFTLAVQGEGSAYWLLRLEIPDSLLGQPERNPRSKIHIAPNPVKNELQLHLPQAPRESFPYRLQAFTGQIQQRGTIEFTDGRASLDLSGLAPGSYFLMLGEGKQRYGARVVVRE